MFDPASRVHPLLIAMLKHFALPVFPRYLEGLPTSTLLSTLHADAVLILHFV